MASFKALIHVQSRCTAAAVWTPPSRQMQTRRWSGSLESRGPLLLDQGVGNSLQATLSRVIPTSSLEYCRCRCWDLFSHISLSPLYCSRFWTAGNSGNSSAFSSFSTSLEVVLKCSLGCCCILFLYFYKNTFTYFIQYWLNIFVCVFFWFGNS